VNNTNPFANKCVSRVSNTNIVILFPDRNQEGKAIPGAVGRLRDHENATEEAETD